MAENKTGWRQNMALIALCFGFFMVIIDVNIVNVALPNIAKELGGDVSWLQWVVDGYTLTFACLLLSAGHLGDQFRPKVVFLWGLILFSATSIGCGLSDNFWSLTIFRLFQGAAAALLLPTSLALINSSYENPKDRIKAIGIWGAVGGVAAATGPILGGILTSAFGWRSIFFINLPIGLVGVFLTLKYVLDTKIRDTTAFDFYGQILGIISVAALAFALIEAGRFGWSSAIVVGGFVVFVVSFILFLLVEQRVTFPMFPLNLFRSQIFSSCIAIGMLMNVGIFGVFFVLTLYFQQIRGFSPLATGFAFLPMMSVTAITSYLSGHVTNKLGPKTPIVIGTMVAALGFFSLLIAKEHTAYGLLIIPLMAIGFGSSFTMPAATIAVIHSVPGERAGVASAAFNASRQVGSLMGVAIFGTILASSSQFIAAMQITLIIGGIALSAGSITAFCLKNK